MYKMTCSLINSWLYATSPDASESAFDSFLSYLRREPQEKSAAMNAGIAFEDKVTALANPPVNIAHMEDEAEFNAAVQFANRVKGGMPQVYATKEIMVCGLKLKLVGIADFIRAGIISDIKRVQRYEYGKYQDSTQHPMYFELFPQAVRFDYLIFDGKYAYMEQYRRQDCPSITMYITEFIYWLEEAGLLEIYKENWEVK